MCDHWIVQLRDFPWNDSTWVYDLRVLIRIGGLYICIPDIEDTSAKLPTLALLLTVQEDRGHLRRIAISPQEKRNTRKYHTHRMITYLSNVQFYLRLVD